MMAHCRYKKKILPRECSESTFDVWRTVGTKLVDAQLCRERLVWLKKRKGAHKKAECETIANKSVERLVKETLEHHRNNFEMTSGSFPTGNYSKSVLVLTYEGTKKGQMFTTAVKGYVVGVHTRSRKFGHKVIYEVYVPPCVHHLEPLHLPTQCNSFTQEFGDVYEVTPNYVNAHDCTGFSVERIKEFEKHLIEEELHYNCRKRAPHFSDISTYLPSKIIGQRMQTTQGSSKIIEGIDVKVDGECSHVLYKVQNEGRTEYTSYCLPRAICYMNADAAKARAVAFYMSTHAVLGDNHRTLMTIFAPFSLVFSLASNTLLWDQLIEDCVGSQYYHEKHKALSGADERFTVACDDVGEGNEVPVDASRYYTPALIRIFNYQLATLINPVQDNPFNDMNDCSNAVRIGRKREHVMEIGKHMMYMTDECVINTKRQGVEAKGPRFVDLSGAIKYLRD